MSLITKLAFGVSAALIVTSSLARADTYDDANRDSQVNLASQQSGAAEVKIAIDAWNRDSKHACGGLDSTSSLLTTMSSEADKAHTLQDSADVSSAARERYREADSVGTPIFLTSYLDLADAYLSGSCLKEADVIYRDVVRKYTGSAYSAFRERASIGIDDVRSQDQNAKPK